MFAMVIQLPKLLFFLENSAPFARLTLLSLQIPRANNHYKKLFGDTAEFYLPHPGRAPYDASPTGP